MTEEKIVHVYQCIYCGIIKKSIDAESCFGCGEEYFHLKPVKIRESDWKKIRRKQKELEKKASQSVDGWLELRKYGEELLELLAEERHY